MPTISSHILDTARGCPAALVAVQLSVLADGDWRLVCNAQTNEDGRIAELVPPEYAKTAGLYRLTFDTSGYYYDLGQVPFYPRVQVEFVVQPDQAEAHFHIPLLLSPYGYSTYRGS